MSENNGFAVLGTMRMLQEGNLTLIQATETVNMWIEITAKKFYNEGVLDGLRRDKKSHQALCDMVPENSAERSQKHDSSVVNRGMVHYHSKG